MSITRILSAAALGAVLWWSQARADKPAAPEPDAAKVPSTMAEHRAAAKSYKEKADSARRDAELHRTMLDRYFNWPNRKAGVVQEDDKWFIEHCRKFIEQASDLATTATALGAFHEKKAEALAKKSAP